MQLEAEKPEVHSDRRPERERRKRKRRKRRRRR
jgi:hypothetical protein